MLELKLNYVSKWGPKATCHKKCIGGPRYPINIGWCYITQHKDKHTMIDRKWTTEHMNNTLRPWQIGRHFADDIFKCIFVNENVWIPIKISLKFVPKGPINNIPALVQIMAWRHAGDKPLSEPKMVSLPTHICVTRPEWDNGQTARNDLLSAFKMSEYRKE